MTFAKVKFDVNAKNLTTIFKSRQFWSHCFTYSVNEFLAAAKLNLFTLQTAVIDFPKLIKTGLTFRGRNRLLTFEIVVLNKIRHKSKQRVF